MRYTAIPLYNNNTSVLYFVLHLYKNTANVLHYVLPLYNNIPSEVYRHWPQVWDLPKNPTTWTTRDQVPYVPNIHRLPHGKKYI